MIEPDMGSPSDNRRRREENKSLSQASQISFLKPPSVVSGDASSVSREVSSSKQTSAQSPEMDTPVKRVKKNKF